MVALRMSGGWSLDELRAEFANGNEEAVRSLCLGQLQDPSYGSPSPLVVGVSAGHFGLVANLIDECYVAFPDFDPGVADLIRAAAGVEPSDKRMQFLTRCLCEWSEEPEKAAGEACEGLPSEQRASLEEALAVYL
jgi:hypothetical protein